MPEPAEIEALRAAAKRVLEADMRGVRDLDALNALEDAAGFSQQGQRRSPQGEDHDAATVEKIIALIESNHGAYLIDKHRPEDLSAFIRGQFPSPSRDGTVAVHDAYVEPLDGGHRGYQARCWTCDWTGPEHLRGTETLGGEESRTHKRAAKADAAAHRAGESNERGNQ
jgi:hypothetical protein